MNALSNPAVAAPPETLLNRPFLLVLMVAAVFGFSFSSFFLLPKFLSVALAADAVSIGSITTISRLVRSDSFLFSGLVSGPNITRWNSHSM